MPLNKSYSEITGNRRLYSASHRVVGGIAKTALGLKVRGVENIPENGGALIASNHRHWLDVFLGPVSIPNRHLSMVAKEEVYETPILGWFFKQWDTIPVNRENPSPRTTREVVERLKAGRLVGAAPEGTRSQEVMLGELHEGVVRWAKMAKVVIIPAVVRGADSFPYSVLHRSAEVLYGTPLDPPTSHNDVSLVLENLRESIQDLYNS